MKKYSGRDIMRKIISYIQTQIKVLQEKLIDDESNKKIVALCMFVVAFLICAVMTIMNVITSKGWLTLATGAFTVLSAINIILAFRGQKAFNFALVLFTVEVIVMFTFFLISGNPEGFSSMWIPMIPTFGMLLYGRSRGSLVSGIMWVIMAALLWTPLGQMLSMYEYSASFQMRFPILFIAYFLLALLLETLRALSLGETKRLQALYKELSIRDSLTGLFNRQGFYTAIRDALAEVRIRQVGVIIFDIDHFKNINDTYGHSAGDIVLKTFANMIKTDLDMIVCRWGGEEFAAVYFDNNVTHDDLENFRKKVSEYVFDCFGSEVHMTVSLGVCEAPGYRIGEIEQLADMADVALYEAKNNGRNKVVYYNDLNLA